MAKTWFMLLRPWSLTASIVPFAVVLPLAKDPFAPARAVLALAAAMLLQTACNLLNTWGDWKSGLDSKPGAKASVPVLVEGRVSPRAVLAAAIAALAGAAACAAPLIACGAPRGAFNLPLMDISLAGFAGAVNYATLLRFKYAGLGVPFVFVLMGPLFFAGVYAAVDNSSICGYAASAAVSIPVACHVAAILHGNDMRDRASDGAAGVRTAAVRFGPRGAFALYAALLLAPYALCAIPAALVGAPAAAFLSLASLPLAFRAVRTARAQLLAAPGDPQWSRLERAAGAVHFTFGCLYGAGFAIWL